jgi:hypothetical protein
MFIFILLIAVIIGGGVIAYKGGQKEGAIAQEDSEGYAIVNIPKSQSEIKRIFNAQFGSLFWANVAGEDDGIYKELKLMGKLAGLGPTVGIVIRPSADDHKKSDVFISLVHYQTVTQLVFITNYPGVKKAHRNISRLRQALGDPTLDATEEQGEED